METEQIRLLFWCHHDGLRHAGGRAPQTVDPMMKKFIVHYLFIFKLLRPSSRWRSTKSFLSIYESIAQFLLPLPLSPSLHLSLSPCLNSSLSPFPSPFPAPLPVPLPLPLAPSFFLSFFFSFFIIFLLSLFPVPFVSLFHYLCF